MNRELENCKDVFLSHSSRDKEPYVRKFAKELDKLGISYWLDRAEIKWGDKITRKINEGLKSSRYVIVFLSENFLGANWPEAELEAALNKENSNGQTVVLPIIIGDSSKILNRYPLLRDKLYLEWDDDLSTILSHLTNLLAPNSYSTVPPPSKAREGIKIHPTALRRYFAKGTVKFGLIGGSLLLIGVVGIFFLFNYSNESSQNSSVPLPDSLIGKEITATTDINLRTDPDSSSTKIGMAERGSRMIILRVSGKWYEVNVVEHGRPKEDSGSEDKGWVHSSLTSLHSQ